MKDEILIEVKNLSMFFPVRGGLRMPFSKSSKFIRAVDDVSLHVSKGETLAIVGESGCGKTTLARCIMLLLRPTCGAIKFEGQDITKLKGKSIQKNMQIVFQDPEASLDPRYSIRDSVSEPLEALTNLNKKDIEERITETLKAVGLGPEFMDRTPRQLSGGQKQRVSIARAISPNPKLVVLDEPTSALDASIQAQLLNLLLKLQEEFDLSYVLIMHNVAAAKYLADRIAVMYCGKIVESGEIKAVINDPVHPYTKALISSAPIPNPWERNILKAEIVGEIPSTINPPSGCRFHPRCPYVEKICFSKHPELEEVKKDHFVACHNSSTTTVDANLGSVASPTD